VPVSPAADPNLPFTFSIAMGVRKNDKPLRDEINAVLARRLEEIEAILSEFGVPRVPDPSKQIAEAR
jgi:mxaJ protein